MRALRLTLIVSAVAFCGTAALAETVNYTYDAKGRLVKIVKQNTPYVEVNTTITHDKADNRKRVVSTVTPR